MAIYIKSRKESETDSYVIYRYGTNPDNLNQRLKLLRSTSEVKRLVEKEEFPYDITAMMISARIYGYYKENGFYPEEISKEA